MAVTSVSRNALRHARRLLAWTHTPSAMRRAHPPPSLGRRAQRYEKFHIPSLLVVNQ